MKRSWRNVLSALRDASAPISQCDLLDGSGRKGARGDKLREMASNGLIVWQRHPSIASSWGWSITDAGRKALREMEDKA